MTKRLFYITLGAVVGVLVVRKMSQAAQKFTPAGMQQSMGGALGNLGDSIREFAYVVREGMDEREAELRTALGLDGTHDMVDTYVDPGHTGGLDNDLDEHGNRTDDLT